MRQNKHTHAYEKSNQKNQVYPMLMSQKSSILILMKQNCNYNMSYNEIPNISVESVTLPNKPLSNFEINDAAKRLSLNGFRGVFLRDTPSNNAKLNECGILN